MFGTLYLHGTLIPTYHKITLRVYNVTVPPSYSAGANVSIMADYLSSDTEYVFTCYASSVVGDGEHSDPITVRTGKLSILYKFLCMSIL